MNSTTTTTTIRVLEKFGTHHESGQSKEAGFERFFEPGHNRDNYGRDMGTASVEHGTNSAISLLRAHRLPATPPRTKNDASCVQRIYDSDDQLPVHEKRITCVSEIMELTGRSIRSSSRIPGHRAPLAHGVQPDSRPVPHADLRPQPGCGQVPVLVLLARPEEGQEGHW